MEEFKHDHKRISEKKTAHEVTPVYLRKPQAERELEEKLKGECVK